MTDLQVSDRTKQKTLKVGTMSQTSWLRIAPELVLEKNQKQYRVFQPRAHAGAVAETFHDRRC
jgi:hypothetical protein